MSVQRYNDTFLGNAAVPLSGSQSLGAEPSAPPKAVGRPKGLNDTDGTASPRVTVTTKTWAAKATPTTRSDRRPSAVQTFRDSL